jgi:hypothetical protein
MEKPMQVEIRTTEQTHSVDSEMESPVLLLFLFNDDPSIGHAEEVTVEAQALSVQRIVHEW